MLFLRNIGFCKNIIVFLRNVIVFLRNIRFCFLWNIFQKASFSINQNKRRGGNEREPQTDITEYDSSRKTKEHQMLVNSRVADLAHFKHDYF